MRQLNLKPRTFATPEAQAHNEAEWAEARQALSTLPVPPGLPPTLQAAFVPAGQRFILSIAKQYQNQGLPPIELVQAGHTALVTFAERWDGTLEKWRADWGWWVRQGIMAALAKKT